MTKELTIAILYRIVEKCFDALEEWRKVSRSSVEGEALDGGHYIPEELPEMLLGKTMAFLKD